MNSTGPALCQVQVPSSPTCILLYKPLCSTGQVCWVAYQVNLKHSITRLLSVKLLNASDTLCDWWGRKCHVRLNRSGCRYICMRLKKQINIIIYNVPCGISVKKTTTVFIITLCTYVQQGYMFVCVCVLVCGQKTGCLRSYTWKPPVSVIYSSLVKYNSQKGAHYVRWFIQGKKFGSILLMGRKKGSGKLYYDKPCARLVSMQCSYAMPANAERQHATAVQTYNITTGTVHTDSA